MTNIIKLADRVKELSYTVGTGNLALEGSVAGFSSFGSSYSYNDYLFYAITDGTRYEVGSGQYFLNGSTNSLKRFPLKSSNSNNLVNFPAGLKEVYATYPATNSVYGASGISNFQTPANSGITFWSGANTINYDSSLVFDSTNKRIGLRKANPQYGIDVGGNANQSSVQASGFYVGSSGILFPSGNNQSVDYTGGRQVVHFEPNQLGDANLQAIIELSGVVDNIFLLKEQNAGLVFAGPPSGCAGDCSPALPSFRPLILKDIEEAVDISGILFNNVAQLFTNVTTVSGITVSASGSLRNLTNSTSGVLRNDLTVVSGIAQYGYNSSGILRTDLTTVSGISVSSSGSLNNLIGNVSGVLRSDLTTVSGIAQYGYNSSGVLNNKIYNYDIYDLGNITGVVNLNWAENQVIQRGSLSGVAVTFQKGTGWPSTSAISKDLLLQLTLTSGTSIYWPVIGSNWYNKPSGTYLSSGEYMFLLRAFGNTNIYGFYVGQNTGSL